MADDEELLGGFFGGGGQPAWMNFLQAASSIPTRRERLMGRGGYTPAMPTYNNAGAQAAMLRQRQQQAEVDDLMRVQEMYGQALEWSPDDAEESLKHVMHLYQNAAEPFKTTTGARAFIGMIPKMREEAVKARAGKNLRAGVGGALGQLDPMATPEDFVRLLIQNEVDPATAAALAKIHGESFYTGSPASGMGTRARWGGGGAEQRVGTHFQPPGAGGVPAQQYEFDAQGNIIGRVVPGSVGVQPDKPLLQWTGEEGRAPSPPGFGGIQHTPQQPPIMDPGLEIAAPDQPINLRRPGMPEPMGDRPIDPTRPVIPGLPGPLGLGGRSVEETVGFNLENGQTVLLPTIVQGQRVTPQQAIALYRMGRNEPVGAYGGPQEAETAAQARSQRIGQMLGPEGVPPGAGPRTLYTPPVPTPLPGLEPESQTLPGAGGGTVTYKRAGKGGEKLSQGIQDILETEPPAGPEGSPARQAQIKRALDVVTARSAQLERDKVRAQGDMPLFRSLKANQVVWDRTARAPADALNLTEADVRGKPNQYRVVDAKIGDQLTSIQEMRQILGQFDELSKGLATQPGANFPQAVQMYAKTQLGMDDDGVAWDVLGGTVLRLAGAMQGSRVQLSDQDRRAVEKMLPTKLDGIGSARRRLATVTRILDAMENAQFGDTGGLSAANALLRTNGGDGRLGTGRPTVQWGRDAQGRVVPVQ